MSGRWLGPRAGLLVLAGLLAGGCGGPLVRLAKQEQWQELDARARASKRTPRGKAARAWAEALVELDRVEEARAVLLTDFRHGGKDESLLALADLERARGLVGVAAAHYARLAAIDPDTVSRFASAAPACELLRERARVEAALGQSLAADADMRRVELLCPNSIDADDRALLSSLQPAAAAEARAKHTLEEASLDVDASAVAEREQRLRRELELARKRGPRAVATLADAEGMQVAADDVAVLLAAEFAGALGAGLVSHARLSAWVGDNSVEAVSDAIDTLPGGVREYALLRLASVRVHPDADAMTQAWIVAANGALVGQGPHEAAKGWRISASLGELSTAEFALNTNLRDMIPPAVEPDAEAEGADAGEGSAAEPKRHWSQRVPVDRRSFDLLLTLARLFEERGQTVPALELRRSVLVAGYEVGLAQVAEAAVEEVRRQLILGHPWQALAIAEVVPGPLLDEALPALASAVSLARAAGLGEAIDADQNIVWRALGDAWVEQWAPRFDAVRADLDLGDGERCPDIGRWLDPEAEPRLREVGLDPARSQAAVEAAFAELGAPETGAALAAALESDLALSCSAPVVTLLAAGVHDLRLASLDERLVHAPELAGSLQRQLHAELALAHGEGRRATELTITAAAEARDPRALWARAVRAGLTHGAREYTIEALREVLLHTPDLADPAARRELLLMRLRDVDGDEDLRSGRASTVEALRAQVAGYLDEVPASQRWARVDALLWRLASESRTDARAWSLLVELVDLDARAAAHPRASAALLAAARAAGAELALGGGAPDAGLQGGAPALLSDTRALCEAAASLDGQPLRLVGAAVGCDPRERAEAHADLLAAAPEATAADLRAAILAGPIALEPEPARPAIVHAVPALLSGELIARIVFDLPLEPIWAVTSVAKR